MMKYIRSMDMFNKNPKDPAFIYDGKFFLFSAHDTNMLAMLDNLNLLDRTCLYDSLIAGDLAGSNNCKVSFPEYASNVIFENIFDEKEKQSYIAVRYNGEYVQVCEDEHIYKVKDAEKEKFLCRTDHFLYFVSNRIDLDWKKNCGISMR
jgi:hypothetical protein